MEAKSAQCEIEFSESAGDTVLVRFAGNWTLGEKFPPASELENQLEFRPGIRRVAFDTGRLTGWDSGLLTFLSKIIALCSKSNIYVDKEGLPSAVQRLIALASAVPEKKGTRREVEREMFLSRVGSECGARALPIVSLISLLVDLAGFDAFYPSEITGGMRKRAGLARAMALDADVLFFGEPSAGLDPISAHNLDNLILELRNSLGSTVVVVTPELESLFAIGNNSVFLDPETRTIIAQGDPKKLRDESPDPKVRRFLTRGKEG
jgi:energy-coupling factor transporter ATP-binding protein EcfA2